MNCVTPKGQVCVFVEADNMVVLGEDKENSVKLDWGKIELAVGDKVKITAIEGMEYDTIYIGFPIWWNLAPRIINTFIESGDFAGKTDIPFATSGSSSISNAEKELQTNYPGINWGKGRLLNGASRETVKQWIKK